MKTKTTKNSSSGYNWREEFFLLRPQYEQFVDKLKVLLIDLLQGKGIQYHTIEARTKTVESFVEKISRPGKSYKNPLKEICDLSALRIILYHQEDVDDVCKVLKKEFTFDPKQSVDKRSELAPDQFGYVSVHLVISLGKSRYKLLEWSSFRGMVAEVQVRTVLQHAWASISHPLQYKKEIEIPSDLRRKLIRLSGILELADEQFSEIRKKQAELEEQLTSLFTQNILTAKIDKLSIQKYIDTSINAKNILDHATKVGFGDSTDEIYERKGPFMQLSTVCNMLGIDTIQSLDEMLKEVQKSAHSFFVAFRKLHDFGEAPVSGDKDHWCAVLLVANNRKIFTRKTLYKAGLWNKVYIRDVLAAAKVLL